MTNAITFNEQLYLSHLNLTGIPFPVAPDDRHFFFTPGVERLVAELVHGIMARKGFMILSGDVGLGKTTICRKILSILDENNIKTALVLNTSCQGVALLKQITEDFGIKTAAIDDTRSLMNTLYDFLVTENSKGNNCTIIIDDAQNLDKQSLEMVRMISNLETDSTKLVQILLSGQPELMETLNDFSLRQLKSRIIISGNTSPLKQDEVEQYIRFKLNASGNNGRITLDKKTFQTIFKFTGGNIRRINILMDRALYAAYLYGTLHISKKIIKASINDLNQGEEKQRRPVLTIALPVAALLIAGILYTLVPAFSGLLSTKAHIPLAKTKQINTPDTVPQPVLGVPGNRPGNSKTSSPPQSVIQFLSHYHLGDYSEPFSQALTTGDLRQIKQIIFQKTGKKLIEFMDRKRIPDDGYGLLKYQLPQRKTISYFLFWTPDFIISKFYYLYYGNEIKLLQQSLADINLYPKTIDGIVGKHVMLGVSQFQKNARIDVTGFPTDKTIFLLCSQRRKRDQ